MDGHYQTLGIERNASQAAIKKAYIGLTKKYHPDTTLFDKAFAEQKMKSLNAAYHILSDPSKRAAYDTKIEPDHIEFAALIEVINNISIATLKTLKNINETASIQIIDNISNDFQNKTAIIVKKVLESPLMHNGLLDNIGIVFYTIAKNYFSFKDYKNAKNTNEFAIIFLKKETSKYNDAIVLKKQIATMEDINIFKNLFISFALTPRGIILIIATVCLLIFKLSEELPKYTNTQVATQTITQKAPEQPIPLKNVASGYIENHPKLNNTGLCQLTIDNTQNNAPVYVRLWQVDNSPKAVRAINISENSSFTIENITPGTYEIRYKYLYENTQAQTGSKSEPMYMQQTTTSDGTRYSIMKLTLYKVKNGNTRTYNISGSDV